MFGHNLVCSVFHVCLNDDNIEVCLVCYAMIIVCRIAMSVMIEIISWYAQYAMNIITQGCHASLKILKCPWKKKIVLEFLKSPKC